MPQHVQNFTNIDDRSADARSRWRARLAFIAPVVIGVALLITICMLGIYWYTNRNTDEQKRIERITAISARQMAKFLDLHDTILGYLASELQTSNGDFNRIKNYIDTVWHPLRNDSEVLFFYDRDLKLIWSSKVITEPLKTNLNQILPKRLRSSEVNSVHTFLQKMNDERNVLIKFLPLQTNLKVVGYLGEIIDLAEFVKFTIPEGMLQRFHFSFLNESGDEIAKVAQHQPLALDIAHKTPINDKSGTNLWVKTTNYQFPVDDNLKTVAKAFGLLLILQIFAVWFLARSLAKERQTKEALRITQFSVNNSSDAVYYVDNFGFVRYVNESACKLLEYSKHELLHLKIWELDTNLTQEAWLTRSWIDFSGNSIYATNSFLKTKSGNKFPVELRGNHIRYGEKDFFCIFARDLRERLEVDEKLRLSDLRFRKIFEDSCEAMFLIDVETSTIVDANPRASKLLQYNRPEFMQRHLTDIIVMENWDLKKIVDTIEKSNVGLTLEAKFKNKFRNLIDCEFSASIINIHDSQRLLLTARDITKRREQENALRASEQYFRSMADSAPVLMWMSGPDGQITYFNKSWLEFTGRTLEDELGFGFYESVHPDDREACRNTYMHNFQLRKAYVSESRLRRYDGEYRWRHTRGVPWYGLNREFRGFIGSSIDITDIKNAEKEIRASEAKYRRIYDTSLDGIVTIDFNTGNFIDANPAFLSMLGFTTEEFKVNNFWQLNTNYFDHNFYEKLTSSVYKNNYSEEFETDLQHKDGHRVYVKLRFYGIKNPDTQKLSEIWGIVSDISERKDYERRLLTTQYAIDHIGDEAFWINEQAQIIYVNEAACKALGYSKEDLTKLTIHDIDPLYTKERWTKTWAEVKQEKFRKFQTTHMRKDGAVFDVEVTTSYVKYEDTGYCFAFARDISDRKLYEQGMHKAKELAEDANRAKSLFLANMSHEIRTPMSAILGFTEMLSRDNLSEEQRSKYIYTIQKNSEHLLKLINDILDLSKVESGKFVAKISELNVRNEIESVTALFKEQVQQKNLYLNVEFDKLTPKIIFSDGDRLRQILINIIGNAIKFTASGGIQVQVRETLLSPKDKCPSLEISVADTGCGINEIHVNKLFEPFVQINPYLSRSTSGTGLGLALARKFAQELGGNVVLLQTSPGYGCVFQILVAADLNLVSGANLHNQNQQFKDESSYKAVVAPMSKNPVSLVDAKILLVEDGPDNQILLNHFLCSAGANVEIAENGEVAVQKAKQSLYDVVLMDIQMPILDGYKATRLIRDLGVSTPVIALTAHAMSGEKERCLQAGCDDYLTKPINSSTLIQKVSEHLHQKKILPEAMIAQQSNIVRH